MKKADMHLMLLKLVQRAGVPWPFLFWWSENPRLALKGMPPRMPLPSKKYDIVNANCFGHILIV